MINKKYWNKKIQDNKVTYSGLSSEDRANKELIMFLLEERVVGFKDIFKKFQKDKEVVLSSLNGNVYSISYMDRSFLNDKDIVMKIIPYIEVFKDIPLDLINDEDIIKLAVKNSSFSISYLNEKNKKDKSLLFPLLVENFFEFTYVADEIKQDSNFVESVVDEIGKNKKKRGQVAIEYVGENIKDNIRICKKIIKINPFDIKNHLDVIRDDKVFIINLIKHENENKYNFIPTDISDRLKDDEEVCLELIKNNGNTLLKLSKRLQMDREMVKIAINQFISFQDIDDIFKNDKEIVNMALDKYIIDFKYAGELIKDDKDIALKVVQKEASMFEYVSERLKNDKDVAWSAISKNHYFKKFIGEQLLQDGDFIKKCLEKYIDIKIHPIFENNTEILVKSLKLKTDNIKYASDKLKNNIHFNLELLMNKIDIFDYLNDDLKNNKSIIFAHVNYFRNTLARLNIKNRKNMDLIVDCIKINEKLELPNIIINSEDRVLELMKKILKNKDDLIINNILLNQMLKNKSVHEYFLKFKSKGLDNVEIFENILNFKDQKYLEENVLKSNNKSKKIKF